jgi:20S proteasome alpha/beta subunit
VATSEGVILGVEKRVTSTLLETSSVEKIVEIDRHIGCAMSGLQADARSMVEHARVECQSHAFNYNEQLRVESCTQAICDLALRFGESADGEESIMSRPFGVALLIAGYDEDGPSLYHAEPSGTFYRYDAKAIGSGSEGAQAELQNEYHKVCVVVPGVVPNLDVSFHVLTAWLLALVPHDRRRRDARAQDAQAGHGGEARRQERPTGQRHQGPRLQNIHGRGDGRRGGAPASELDGVLFGPREGGRGQGQRNE